MYTPTSYPHIQISHISGTCGVYVLTPFHYGVCTSIFDFFSLSFFGSRAIKIAEKNNPESLKDFRKVVKCEASLAEQLWKRLEREGKYI